MSTYPYPSDPTRGNRNRREHEGEPGHQNPESTDERGYPEQERYDQSYGEHQQGQFSQVQYSQQFEQGQDSGYPDLSGPGFSTPDYGSQGYGDPGYAQPGYEQPGYGQGATPGPESGYGSRYGTDPYSAAQFGQQQYEQQGHPQYDMPGSSTQGGYPGAGTDSFADRPAPSYSDQPYSDQPYSDQHYQDQSYPGKQFDTSDSGAPGYNTQSFDTQGYATEPFGAQTGSSSAAGAANGSPSSQLQADMMQALADKGFSPRLDNDGDLMFEASEQVLFVQCTESPFPAMRMFGQWRIDGGVSANTQTQLQASSSVGMDSHFVKMGIVDKVAIARVDHLIFPGTDLNLLLDISIAAIMGAITAWYQKVN